MQGGRRSALGALRLILLHIAGTMALLRDRNTGDVPGWLPHPPWVLRVSAASEKNNPFSGLVVPTFEFRAHVAVHRYMLMSVTSRLMLTCYMCRNCTRCHIHTLHQKSSEYIKVRVHLEDMDVPDTMIRPSSLIGMDE